MVFTNQRQTYDITVAKTLVSNTTATTSFVYSASYTDSYTSGGNTVISTTNLSGFTVSSGGNTVLEDIPAGVTLTITEAPDADNNYIVAAVSANGATDSDSSENGFAFTVTQDDTVTYTNTLKSYPVIMKLVDQAGNELHAMFSLASSLGSLGTDLYAGANGVFYTSNQFWVDTYTLNQTTTPTGYISLQGTPVTIMLTGNGITSDNSWVTAEWDTVNSRYVITVKNWEQKPVTVKKILNDPLLSSTRNFEFSYSYTSPVDGQTVSGTFTLGPTVNNANGASRTLSIPANATDLVITEVTTGSYANIPNIYDTVSSGVGADGTTTITDADTTSNYIFKVNTVTQSATITFSNTRKEVDVTIEKVVVGTGGTFHFSASLKNGATPLSGYNLHGFTAGAKTFDLSPANDGSASVVMTVPYGVVITVEETADPSYTTSVGGNQTQSYTSPAITENTTITFTNTEVRIAPTSYVAKTGSYWWLLGGGVVFMAGAMIPVIIRRKRREANEA